MPSADSFVARAQELAADSPYVVTRTSAGCEIHADLTNATWWGVMSRQHLERTFTHLVELDEGSGIMKVTDESRSVSWSAGVDGEATPKVGGTVSTTRGRVIEKSFGHEYGWGDDGRFGEQVDYTFDSAEGRALIAKVADEQGWKEGLSTDQRIGLYVALGAVGLVVVIGVLTAILLAVR